LTKKTVGHSRNRRSVFLLAAGFVIFSIVFALILVRRNFPPAGHENKEKLISSPAIQFKGSGFYITDYAKKNSPSEEKKVKADSGQKETAESKPAEAKSSEAKPAPAKSEAKTAPKTETKGESRPAAKKSDA